MGSGFETAGNFMIRNGVEKGTLLGAAVQTVWMWRWSEELVELIITAQFEIWEGDFVQRQSSGGITHGVQGQSHA